MSISNAQYDEIMRTYEETRNKNRHISEERKNYVYDKLPEYKALDSSVAQYSLELGKKLIDGDLDALTVLRQRIKEVAAQKTELLLKLKLPADYLDPIYSCKECKDTGYVDNIKCSCFKQAIINKLYYQSNLADKLKQENFTTFDYDLFPDDKLEDVNKLVNDCKAFVDEFSVKGRNLLFMGDVGCGKTFMTNCIAKEILDRGYSVLYFTSAQLFDTLAKYVFRAKSEEEDIDRFHEHIYDCDLLIIDDLGTESTNSFVQNQLFMILNERDLRHKSMIISTNLDFATIRDIYSNRVFSRLFSSFDAKKFDNEDIRVNKKRLGL